jgi:hypothetical protein
LLRRDDLKGGLDEKFIGDAANFVRETASPGSKICTQKSRSIWRLAEKTPSENYREQHMKQAKAASELASEKNTPSP